ncbi:hypothetical protein AURDEDRAFT_131774 [Auricularia subglabra TFB-10046 SS5]|uniref:Uncharacterized protein n=1 Tax=Auricularia subglabra (strain TFB-10046 / SS5) TaxID=717982 RepID=J0CSK7_AURST|nr:hypothetical protein AURDEDRAFT_131774 [Auricularia subglabra TFB-10046 SS5]
MSSSRRPYTTLRRVHRLKSVDFCALARVTHAKRRAYHSTGGFKLLGILPQRRFRIVTSHNGTPGMISVDAVQMGNASDVGIVFEQGGSGDSDPGGSWTGNACTGGSDAEMSEDSTPIYDSSDSTSHKVPVTPISSSPPESPGDATRDHGLTDLMLDEVLIDILFYHVSAILAWIGLLFAFPLKRVALVGLRATFWQKLKALLVNAMVLLITASSKGPWVSSFPWVGPHDNTYRRQDFTRQFRGRSIEQIHHLSSLLKLGGFTRTALLNRLARSSDRLQTEADHGSMFTDMIEDLEQELAFAHESAKKGKIRDRTQSIYRSAELCSFESDLLLYAALAGIRVDEPTINGPRKIYNCSFRPRLASGIQFTLTAYAVASHSGTAGIVFEYKTGRSANLAAPEGFQTELIFGQDMLPSFFLSLVNALRK